MKLDNDKGADAFVHYNLMYYISAALMVAVIYSLFDERENGMWQIVHNTPNGRTVLALKRLLLLAGGSFAILFLRHDISYSDAVIRRSKGFGKSGTDLCGFWKIYIYTQ